jgi:hypothetical protein
LSSPSIYYSYIFLILAIILTWGTFGVFPTTPEAHKVVGVFAGIFGVIAGSVGLYKLLTELK